MRNTIFQREKAQSYIECMNEVYRRFIEEETTILLIRDRRQDSDNGVGRLRTKRRLECCEEVETRDDDDDKISFPLCEMITCQKNF